MRIKQIHIEHFGTLSDYDYSFSEGCTVFCRENGWGKTTLSVFLRVMFYGFGKKGSGPRERALYRPWNGGIYGGSLTFETEGKSFTVLRTFGDVKTGRDDRFQLIDNLTGKPSAAFSDHLGQELFGINEDSFLSTACMMQDDCSTEANSDITSKVGARTGSDQTLLNDINKYDEISRLMNEQLNRLSDKKSTGQIYRKKQDILQLEMMVRKGESVDDAIEKLERKKSEQNAVLSDVAKKLKELSDRMNEYSIRQDYIARADQYSSLKREYQRRKTEWESCTDCFSHSVPDSDLLLRLIRDSEELGNLEERTKLSALSEEEQKQLRILQRDTIDRNMQTSSSPVQPFQMKHLHEQQIRSVIMSFIGIILLMAGILIGFPRTAAGSFLFPTGLAVTVFGIMSSISTFAVNSRQEDDDRSDKAKTLSEQDRILKHLTEKLQRHEQAAEQLKELREVLSSGIRSLGYEPEDQIRQQLLQIRRDVDRTETAEREYKDAEMNLQLFLKNNPGIADFSPEMIPDDLRRITSMEELTGQQFCLREEERKLRERIDHYDRQIRSLLDERQELSAKEEKLMELREQLKELERRQWLIRTTHDIMYEARDSFASRYMRPVQQAFEKYYRMIDPQLREELIIDSTYSIHVRAGGMIRETDVLSRGYRNLASLCIRLALLETMYEKEKPFLILDDPFLFFDDDKYERSMHFLNIVSEQFQVILFTCSAGRTDIGKSDKNVI